MCATQNAHEFPDNCQNRQNQCFILKTRTLGCSRGSASHPAPAAQARGGSGCAPAGPTRCGAGARPPRDGTAAGTHRPGPRLGGPTAERPPLAVAAAVASPNPSHPPTPHTSHTSYPCPHDGQGCPFHFSIQDTKATSRRCPLIKSIGGGSFESVLSKCDSEINFIFARCMKSFPDIFGSAYTCKLKLITTSRSEWMD